MATAKDIAAYILRRAGPMSTMKLQKLVYYAQAWSLARLGKPLFSEQVQAWAHGPVVYELFELHRGRYAVESLPGATRGLAHDDSVVVDDVIARYGSMTADELSRLTHAEEPWRAARAGVPDGQRASAVITPESIRRSYSRRPVTFPV